MKESAGKNRLRYFALLGNFEAVIVYGLWTSIFLSLILNLAYVSCSYPNQKKEPPVDFESPKPEDLSLLLELSAGSSEFSYDARTALTKLNDYPAVIDELARMLKSEDIEARRRAASGLFNMGDAPGVEIALITGMSDSEDDIRMVLVHAMGNLSPSDAIFHALVLAHENDVSNIRIAAIDSLCLTGFDPEKVSEILIDSLNDPDSFVRECAAFDIGYHDYFSDATIRALSACLDDDDPQVRKSAAYSLGEAGSMASFTLPILRTHSENDEPIVRLAAANAVGKVEGSYEDEIPTLVSLLSSKDVKIQCLKILAGIGADAKEVLPSLNQLQFDSDRSVSLWAKTCASEINGEYGVTLNELKRFIDSCDEDSNGLDVESDKYLMECIEVLCRISAKDTDAFDQLIDYLKNGPTRAKMFILSLAPTFLGPKTKELTPVIEPLLDSEDRALAYSARKALERLEAANGKPIKLPN
ncbi:MAG TPA: HEAT repeat domain-containing protein [Acidobacteriota bacterium]|nr:HEAT repeat domain-containing protein [Acidobacteriota bacterium]